MKAVKEIQKLREKGQASCGQTSLWFGRGAGRIVFEDGWTFVWIRSSRGTFVRWWYGPEDEVLWDSGFKDRRPPFKGLRAYERWLARVKATREAIEKEADYLHQLHEKILKELKALPDNWEGHVKTPYGAPRVFRKENLLETYDRYWLETGTILEEMLQQLPYQWAKDIIEFQRRTGRYINAVRIGKPEARKAIYEDWKAEVCA